MKRPARPAPRLAIAESPAKQDMLDLLDRTRKRVESGEVIALMVAPIEPDNRFTTATCGKLDSIERIGLLMTMVGDLLAAGRSE